MPRLILCWLEYVGNHLSQFTLNSFPSDRNLCFLEYSFDLEEDSLGLIGGTAQVRYGIVKTIDTFKFVMMPMPRHCETKNVCTEIGA